MYSLFSVNIERHKSFVVGSSKNCFISFFAYFATNPKESPIATQNSIR